MGSSRRACVTNLMRDAGPLIPAVANVPERLRVVPGARVGCGGPAADHGVTAMTEVPRPGPPPRVVFRGPSPAVRRFLATESAGSVFLLIGTVLALAWANSPWSAAYTDFWHTPVGFGVGPITFEMSLQHWVNDAAMAVFFCVIGLEITREVAQGDLRDRRTVIVPTIGAVGGLLVPIAIYLLMNPSGEAARGWGVVMSTDTAFVLGILALFGP